jgi:hypothetical protein
LKKGSYGQLKQFEIMKKVLITLGAALLMSSTAMAQRGGRIDPVQATERMTENLGLSEEQEAQVLVLNKEFKVEADKLRASQEANRESMKKAYEAHKAKLALVLTKEQMVILEKEEAMRKEKMKKGDRAKQNRRMQEGPEMDMD